MIRLDNFTYHDIFPSSLLLTEEDQAMASGITAMLQHLCSFVNLVDPRTEIPDSLLDVVAAEKHVDFYNSTLPADQKRQLIARSDFFHQRKGTPAAVEELITILFGEGKVMEWYEYGGEPYHFKVVTNNRSVTNEMAQQFIKAVDSVKNKRSVLEKVEISMSEDMNLYVGSVIHTGDKLLIKQVM